MTALLPIVATALAGALLLPGAGFIALCLRFAQLRAEVDLHYLSGALDADQASSLRGDIARRTVSGQLLRVEHDEALAKVAALLLLIEIIGEGLDDAVEENEALWRAADRLTRRVDNLSLVGTVR